MSKKVVDKKEKKEVVEVTGAALKVKNGESRHNDKTVTAMFSKILKNHAELSLVENAWGALQVKRSGDVLFSARRDGRMIISHPMYTGTGKTKERVFKHPGGHYDYLSMVPFANVTQAMLEARIADPKTTKDHWGIVYKGRESESGWVMKKAAVTKKIEDVAKETKGKVSKKKVEAIVAKRKAAVKREPVSKALAQVAAEVVGA